MSVEALRPPELLDEADLNLRGYLAVVRRRWWILTLTFLLGVGAAAGLSLAMVPLYRASTTVAIDKSPPLVLLDRSGDFSLFADQAAAQAPDVSTLVELTKSAVVREGAVARLVPTLGAEAGDALDRLTVQQIRETELVRISVEHSRPEVAEGAANAVVASLIEMNLKDRRRRASETRAFIETQLARESERLRRNEDALVAFKDQHGDVSLAEETTLNLQKLAELEAQRVDLRLQQQEVQARITQGRARLSRQTRIAPTQWTPSPLIATLQDELAMSEIELSGLREQFTDKHPRVASMQAKIEETKRRLRTELSRSLQALQFGVDPVYQQLAQQVAEADISRAALGARERALAAAVGFYEERVRGVPARETDLARLTRSAKETEEIYLLLSAKLQEARIAEASIGSAIRQVDRARPSHSPVRPRHLANLLLGAIVGLVLGVAGIVVREELDDTVRSGEEVERLLGTPILGSIPLVAGDGRALPLMADLDRSTTVAEAFRGLRTHVTFALPDVEPKVLLLTSPTPREGKSTVAINLAFALARAERRVWLVDADMRCPALGRLFPEAAQHGFADFLAGRVKVEQVVHRVSDSVWFVASGDRVPNPTELLAGRKMGEFLTAARARADIVLFDSPPVLAVTDAEVLGSQVDGVLLVVRAGHTGRRSLIQTRQRLAQVGVRLAGAVLTGVAEENRGAYARYFPGTSRLTRERNRTSQPVRS